MAENDTVRTSEPIMLSINKLMDLYKEALLQIAPELDKAQINWKMYDQFEEVETICESLFNLIIKYKLEDYVEGKYSFKPNIPAYSFYLKNYSNLDYIQVQPDDSGDIYAFVLVKSKEESFDTIMCDKLDTAGNIIERENEFNWDEVDFIFKFKKNR